jgi:hypothetical protein
MQHQQQKRMSFKSLREEVEKGRASVLIGRQKWEKIEREYETGSTVVTS